MAIAKKIILIGGSAGSFGIISTILENLPMEIPYAICIVIHRNKNFSTKIEKTLSRKLNRKIISVGDKIEIEENVIYFAPPGYHLIVEPNFTFSLDVSEHVNYSQPSIDVLFETSAQVFKNNCIAFLLSGANKDGAEGLCYIEKFGGKTYIQDPEDAIIDTMPISALANTKKAQTLKNKEIITYFCQL